MSVGRCQAPRVAMTLTQIMMLARRQALRVLALAANPLPRYPARSGQSQKSASEPHSASAVGRDHRGAWMRIVVFA